MAIKITEIEYEEEQDVYDISVDGTNRFYANDIVVHNCTEILQRNTPSVMNNDLSYAVMGEDISCNLGSMNIAMSMMNDPEKSVRTAIRALSSVSDQTDIDSVPTIQNGNRKSHSIGLGQMNLHGFLGKEKIHYDSEEAVDFTDIYFMAIAYYAVKASNELAIEKNQTFDRFETSKYADGSYFDKYLEGEYLPKTERVKKLFSKYSKFKLPTLQDWQDLKVSVMKHGIYNAYIQTVPPTGSISYINNSTASIHPITSQIEIRKEGKLGRVYYPAPHMNADNIEYFKDAYEIGPRALINIYAAAQKHVDQSLSCTLFLKSTDTTKDINRIHVGAWSKGLKSLYYVRMKQVELKAEECVACAL